MESYILLLLYSKKLRRWKIAWSASRANHHQAFLVYCPNISLTCQAYHYPRTGWNQIIFFMVLLREMRMRARPIPQIYVSNVIQ